jgi:hypothetical protein
MESGHRRVSDRDQSFCDAMRVYEAVPGRTTTEGSQRNWQASRRTRFSTTNLLTPSITLTSDKHALPYAFCPPRALNQ